MATKFYLRNTAQTTPISPTIDAAWETSVSLVRALANTAKTSDTLTTVNVTESSSTNKDIAIRQYITPLPKGQVITGAQAVKFQCRVSETGTGNNMFTALGIRVIASDGTTVRKTVLAVTIDDTEATTTITNRQFTATSAATNYTAVDGDYLVIEIGMSGDPTSTNPHDFAMSLGDSAASDLAEDNTTTTANNPWVSLNDTLTTGISSAQASAAGAASSSVVGNGLAPATGSAAGTTTGGLPVGDPYIADTYNESNSDTSTTIYQGSGVGQSFSPGAGEISSVKFFIRKNGSPTGNCQAKIFAHSGVFGTSSVGTGSPLAISADVDTSSLSTSDTVVEFTFTGANRFTPAPNTKYIAALIFDGGDGSNNIVVNLDVTSPTHAGNLAFVNSSGIWNAESGWDLIFYVYQERVRNAGSTAASTASASGVASSSVIGTGINGSAAAASGLAASSILSKFFDLLDSWSPAANSGFLIGDDWLEIGQSFTPSLNRLLESVCFTLSPLGSPTGNIVAKIYAHSGTYGSSSVPTGTALATSDPIDTATLSGVTEYRFTFPGSLALDPTLHYVAAVAYTGTPSDQVIVWYNSGSHDHPGNMAFDDSGSWFYSAGNDLIFKVYGLPGAAYGTAAGIATVSAVGDFTSTGSTASAAGVAASSVVGASIATATATSSAVASSSIVGASTAASTASATAQAASSVVGSSIVEAVASAAATASTSVVGASIAASTAASSGLAASSVVGASTAASQVASTGIAAASSIGISTAASSAESAGASTVASVGTGIVQATGVASGTASSAVVGAEIAASTAVSAGTATDSVVGAATAASVGAASGIASSSTIGSATVAGQAAAAGIAAASIVGSSTAASIISSAAISIILGIGASRAEALAVAEASASADAGGQALSGSGSEATASGIGVATALSISIAAAIAQSTAAASSATVGSAIATAAGQSASLSVVTASGASTMASSAAASGVTTGAAIGRSTAASISASEALSTVASIATAILDAVLVSSASATVSGIGTAVTGGLGTIACVGIAQFDGISIRGSYGISAGSAHALAGGFSIAESSAAGFAMTSAAWIGTAAVHTVGYAAGVCTVNGKRLTHAIAHSRRTLSLAPETPRPIGSSGTPGTINLGGEKRTIDLTTERREI